MKREESRRILIDATIQVIAREGWDKATTKAIAREADMNEVYIYRIFGDKEGLIVAAFEDLDRELKDALIENVDRLYASERGMKERCYDFFDRVWKFLLQNQPKCTAFLRYYYSPYFKKNSAEKHRELFDPIVLRIAPAFIKGSEPWLLLSHIMDIMLASAIKVFNKEVPENDPTEKHVFELVYASIEGRLVWSEKQTKLPH